jgi:hypothetical protein
LRSGEFGKAGMALRARQNVVVLGKAGRVRLGMPRCGSVVFGIGKAGMARSGTARNGKVLIGRARRGRHVMAALGAEDSGMAHWFKAGMALLDG